MSFDKQLLSCNYHHNQDTEQFHHPQNYFAPNSSWQSLIYVCIFISFRLSCKWNRTVQSLFLKYIYLFYLLFLAVLGLRCCVWAFSSCGERELLFFAVRGLLIVVASLLAEHGLWARGLQ